MMRGHHEMRQCRLQRGGRGGGAALHGGRFAYDAARAQRLQEVELAAARGRCAAVRQVDDLALSAALDGGVGGVDEVTQAFGQPVIAARLAEVAVHALLDDHPLGVVGDDEAMQIEVEAVLHGGAVDLGDEPAGGGQAAAVEADALADQSELVRGLARLGAAAAADMQPELCRHGSQAALQRADHAGRDARGVPIHAHHGAEGLEPERMRQTAQQLVAAVVLDHRLADQRAEPGHPFAEPARHLAAVERQVGASGSSSQGRSLRRSPVTDMEGRVPAVKRSQVCSCLCAQRLNAAPAYGRKGRRDAPCADRTWPLGRSDQVTVRGGSSFCG